MVCCISDRRERAPSSVVHGSDGAPTFFSSTRLATCCVKLLYLSLLLTIVQVAHAQSDEKNNNETDVCEPSEDAAGLVSLIGYAASDGPLKREFYTNTNDSVRNSYKWMLGFAEYMDYITTTAAIEENYMTEEEKIESHDRRLAVCNSKKDNWVTTDAAVYFEIRCWGLPMVDCVTDVQGTNDKDFPKPENEDYDIPSQKTLYEKVIKHNRYVNSVATKAVDKVFPNKTANSTWGEGGYRGTGYAFDNTNQRCLLDFIGFVKLKGIWYIAERITNRKRRTIAESLKRQYLYEYIHPDEDVPSPTMFLVNNATGEREEATTAIYLSDGFERPSAFSDIVAAENLAIERAIELGDHRAQQADDATTPSNIAILALPLVMNLIPVALIADVNTVGMLLYTLLTDVLTAVPLAIKGVEVLQIGLRPTYAAISRITGATFELNAEQSGGDKLLEVWVSECRAETSLLSTGITLLVVALIAMVGGIIAEFVAKRWASRKGTGRVIEDPWTGADVPLVDVVGVDAEPISSTTTVIPSLGGASASSMLAAHAALRERESVAAAATAAAAAAAAAGSDAAGSTAAFGPAAAGAGVGGHGTDTEPSNMNVGANLQQRVSDAPDRTSAAYPKPVRPPLPPRASNGQTESNREKQA